MWMTSFILVVEHRFESTLSRIGEIDLMGQVSHFLGIEFTWKTLPNDNLCVTLTQQSFIESLLDSLDIIIDGTSLYTSPYRSGIHIDSIPSVDLSPKYRDILRLKYQSLVGSLNWLLFLSWHNIRVHLLLAIMMQRYMWLSI